MFRIRATEQTRCNVSVLEISVHDVLAALWPGSIVLLQTGRDPFHDWDVVQDN